MKRHRWVKSKRMEKYTETNQKNRNSYINIKVDFSIWNTMEHKEGHCSDTVKKGIFLKPYTTDTC